MAPSRIALRGLAPLALIAPALAGDLFEAPLYLPGAEHGEFRANGDFNGDGKQDLLHMSSPFAWDELTVFLGDGQGGFTAQTPYALTIPAGYEYAELDPVVGDFDGDGDVDVAVERNSFFGTDGLVVYWGDGAGGFSGKRVIDLGSYVAAFYAGQTDADTAVELLVKHNDVGFQSHLTWLDWNGTGFQTSASLPVGGTPDPDGLFVETLADLDGDGDDDVVGTSTSPHALVRVFPTVAGSSTYGPSLPVPVELQNVNHRIKAGDLDGDGDPDLVHLKMTTSDPGPWVQSYENVGGVLTQRPAANVPTPTTGWFQPHRLVLADWDGDGWLDLFALNIALDILRSNGDWTFGEGLELNGLTQSTGGGAFDFNSDGNLDYAGGRTLHLGSGNFAGPEVATSGITTSFPGGVVPEDFEGDGDVDFVGGEAGVRLHNDGVGGLSLSTSGPSGFQGHFQSPPPGKVWGSSVALGDFTGDGLDDYLVRMETFAFPFSFFDEMRLLAADGLGSYRDLGTAIPGSVALTSPAPAPDAFWDTADVNGDGAVDLLVDGGYWRNSGTGALTTFVAAWPGRALDAADVDGDGDTDLVVRTTLGSVSQLWLQVQSGPSGFAGTLLGTLDGQANARFVDLDHDGDLDLACADSEGDELLLFEDLGTGFGPAVSLEARVPDLRMLGIADVDGDGTTDLLVPRHEDAGLVVPAQLLTQYRRTPGSLTYTLEKELFPASGPYDGLLDIDGDGDLDLVGSKILRSQLVEAPDGGQVLQFGQGSPGTGDVVPVLGAAGPITSGNPGAELRLVQAVGGTLQLLGVSTLQVTQVDFPFPGMNLYLGAPVLTGPFPVGGPTGAAGAGSSTLPLPTGPGLTGLTLLGQAFVLDTGVPSGWAATNALALTFGL